MADTQATESGSPPSNGTEAQPTQVIARRPDRTPLSQRDPASLAKHFATSGFFKDARDVSKAVVKIVAGEELGIGPMAAMTGIHIIEGKPSLSANLLAVQVKRSERYEYKPTETTDQRAAIDFYEGDEKLGTSEFTIEQAKRAGLVRPKSGWEKFPEAMLFARALSQGVRWYCPDVTAGAPAYTPEELGAEVNEQGDVVQVEAEVEVVDPEPAPQLDPERVEHLAKGIEVAGPEMGGANLVDGLNLLLGSIGIDSFDPLQPIPEQLAKLSPEQADTLEAELQKTLDAVAEREASAEGEEAGDVG